MNFAACRLCAPLVLAFFLLTLGHAALAQDQPPARPAAPAAAPEHLVNNDFECSDGGYVLGEFPPDQKIDDANLIPTQWQITRTAPTPVVSSARIFFAGSCDGSAHVERIAGIDSVLIQALDIEWSDAPGKPFDASLIQQVSVISGAGYSLSGWMLTLCGGSNTVPRNDCPEGYYMAKLLGIDLTGGVDPGAASVQWVENRRNFVKADGVSRYGWQNLRMAATAEAMTLTVFARINSPFRWHGNHGFIDALSLMRAPTATITATPPLTGMTGITLTWRGDLGPDIPLISNGNHRLLFDVDYWNSSDQRWKPFSKDSETDGETVFIAPCSDVTYKFRVQPRAEQPEGANGARPNQRYPGLWRESDEVFVPSPPPAPTLPFTATDQIYLPAISIDRDC